MAQAWSGSKTKTASVYASSLRVSRMCFREMLMRATLRVDVVCGVDMWQCDLHGFVLEVLRIFIKRRESLALCDQILPRTQHHCKDLADCVADSMRNAS